MSYISVQHLLDSLLTAQRKFLRWAANQESRCDGPACDWLLTKIVKDGRVREDALREAISRSSRDTLTTQIQYESLGDVSEAVEKLPAELPDDPSSIIEPVSAYYTAVTETLRLAAREAEASSSAERMLHVLADETAAVIANEAWIGRDSSDYR